MQKRLCTTFRNVLNKSPQRLPERIEHDQSHDQSHRPSGADAPRVRHTCKRLE